MSKPTTDKSTFVPAPLDGLNLIAGPTSFQPTEARVLDNYWVTDSGIRQIPPPTSNFSAGDRFGMMFTYIQSGTTTERMLFSTGSSIFRLDNPTDGSSTNVTGAAVITDPEWQPCYFNKTIFLLNGVDTPLTHNLGAGNVAAFAPTGPTAANLVQATGYKNRLYCVEKQSTVLWYGGVDAIAGAFTSLDLGAVFSTPGFIAFCTTWTLNQGNGNEDLFVVVNSNGEVLVYSGAYPDAADWQLIARTRIPNVYFPERCQPFAKVSNDVYIATKRGLVALSSAVAGMLTSAPTVTLSKKIKNKALSRIAPVVDPNNPYMYVVNNVASPVGDLYCLNYERGAWSRITMGSLTTNSQIYSTAIFSDHLMIGTGTPDLKLYHIDLNGACGSSFTYKWYTPFFDFGGTNLAIQSNMLRIIGQNIGSSSTVKNTVSISSDLQDPTSPISDTKSTAVAADTDIIQELAPPGYGHRLSYCFSRAGVGSINERNEIRGFDAHYTINGVN